MKKKNGMSNKKKYTGNDVIERGYAIYDGWNDNKFNSRQIVAAVTRTFNSIKRQNGKFRFEALAYIFALDLRIKEKYNSFFRRLFLFFSRRREVRVFNLLKGAFNIPYKTKDMRMAIEVALKNFRKKLATDGTEDEDNETRGGKRSTKPEEEITSEQAPEQQASEDMPDKLQQDIEQTKENKEEAIEEIKEQIPTEEKVQAALDNQQQTVDNEPTEITGLHVQDKKEEIKQEERAEIKAENNGTVKETTPITDKKEEKTQEHSGAIDFPIPIEEHSSKSKDPEKLSFIDEVIIDNMVKLKENLTNPTLSEQIREDRASLRTDAGVMLRTAEDKNNSKDDYLYDQMLRGNKGESVNEVTQTPQIKQEQPKEQTVKNVNPEATKRNFENLRVPIHVDISQSIENDMRRDISWNITPEQVIAIMEGQSKYMREQMAIQLDEEETRAPVNVEGKQEISKTDPIAVSHKK